MRILPRSLFGRLLGIALLTTIAALAFAAMTIGHVLERFATHGFDQQLDAQIDVLAHAVRDDGTMDQAKAISLPAFAESGSGWGWRVDGPAGHWTSGDIIVPSRQPGPPPPPLLPPGPEDRGPPNHRLHPGESQDTAGERVHIRQLQLDTQAGPVLLTAAGPRAVAIAPMREAMVPLLGSLGLLGAALAMATGLQLRLGLAPLRRLRGELADVRSGKIRHISTEQPVEIAPLAVELNALIDQNEEGLAHARRHVSNLAHGLKTPLAALGLKLAESGRDPDGSLSEMVSQIDRRVRHHLGRARAVAAGGNRRMNTPLAPAVAGLVDALERIHAERPVNAVTTIGSDLAVSIDPQDLDEMIGNLLDNAWRHAKSEIRVEALAVDATIVLTIGDDGPGLSDAELLEALMPGRRLDERGDGHGFGLSIAEELAELNSGALTLSRSNALSGLLATLTLPKGSALAKG